MVKNIIKIIDKKMEINLKLTMKDIIYLSKKLGRNAVYTDLSSADQYKVYEVSKKIFQQLLNIDLDCNTKELIKKSFKQLEDISNKKWIWGGN